MLVNALASLGLIATIIFQNLLASGLVLVSAVELYFSGVNLDWKLKIASICLLLKSWRVKLSPAFG